MKCQKNHGVDRGGSGLAGGLKGSSQDSKILWRGSKRLIGNPELYQGIVVAAPVAVQWCSISVMRRFLTDEWLSPHRLAALGSNSSPVRGMFISNSLRDAEARHLSPEGR